MTEPTSVLHQVDIQKNILIDEGFLVSNNARLEGRIMT